MIFSSTLIIAEIKGKDIVKKGELGDFAGKLLIIGEEWVLQTSEDTYHLHFGPQDYILSKDMELQENTKINLTGYLYNKNIAVVEFVYNDIVFKLRDDDGNALWHRTKFANHQNKHYVDPVNCIGCKLCVNFCPTGAITREAGKAVIDPDKCINCGICANGIGDDFSGCPTEAIKKNE